MENTLDNTENPEVSTAPSTVYVSGWGKDEDGIFAYVSDLKGNIVWQAYPDEASLEEEKTEEEGEVHAAEMENANTLESYLKYEDVIPQDSMVLSEQEAKEGGMYNFGGSMANWGGKYEEGGAGPKFMKMYIHSSEIDNFNNQIQELYTTFSENGKLKYISSAHMEAFDEAITKMYREFLDEPTQYNNINKDVFLGNVNRYSKDPARSFLIENVSRYGGFTKYEEGGSCSEGDKFPAHILDEKYNISMLMMGNGTTVYDRNRKENGDYKMIAHINDDGKITFYDKKLSAEIVSLIEKDAETTKRTKDNYKNRGGINKYGEGGRIATISDKEKAKLVDYAYGFYGPDGVYDRYFPNEDGTKGVSKSELENAVEKYTTNISTERWGGGDSIDRENVRDIMWDQRAGTNKNYDKGGKISQSVNSNYLTLIPSKNGLTLVLTEEGKEEAKDINLNEDNFSDLFDQIRSNSEYMYFMDGGDAGFGLTQAPVITEGYYYDDDGELTDQGNEENSRVFAFMDYQINSFAEKLMEDGEVFFQSVDSNYKTGGSVKKFNVGDIVFNKEQNTIGIVRDTFEEGNTGDLRTDADGVVSTKYLQHYNKNNPKHRKATLYPSTKKELGNRIEYSKGGVINKYAVCNSSLEKTTGTSKRSDWSSAEKNRYEKCLTDVEKKNEGGYMEGGGVDLFEDYENIPSKVQKVLDKYAEDFENQDYEGLKKAKEELEKIGYTFEYYLDGVAYDLRKIGEKGKVEANESSMETGGDVEEFDKEKYPLGEQERLIKMFLKDHSKKDEVIRELSEDRDSYMSSPNELLFGQPKSFYAEKYQEAIDFVNNYNHNSMESGGTIEEVNTPEEFKVWADKRNIQLVNELDGFRVGDTVKYTNEYGVSFAPRTIIGIDKDASFYNRRFYLNNDSYWFPVQIETIEPYVDYMAKGGSVDKSNKALDKVFKAKPRGWRFKGENYSRPTAADREKDLRKPLKLRKIYWEGRSNRADKDQRKRFEYGGDVLLNNGGSVNKKWIQRSIEHEGIVRRKAKEMGLIKGDETLSDADLKKINALGGSWPKRVRLARTLKKFREGGQVGSVSEYFNKLDIAMIESSQPEAAKFLQEEILNNPDIILLDEESEEFIELKKILEENYTMSIPSYKAAQSEKEAINEEITKKKEFVEKRKSKKEKVGKKIKAQEEAAKSKKEKEEKGQKISEYNKAINSIKLLLLDEEISKKDKESYNKAISSIELLRDMVESE